MVSYVLLFVMWCASNEANSCPLCFLLYFMIKKGKQDRCLMFYEKFVLIVQIDTSAEEEGEDWGPQNWFKYPVIITGLPKVVLLLRFHLFNVRCCSIFKCFK